MGLVVIFVNVFLKFFGGLEFRVACGIQGLDPESFCNFVTSEAYVTLPVRGKIAFRSILPCNKLPLPCDKLPFLTERMAIIINYD